MSKRPKANKEKQKQESKKARKYLQAKFKQKIGYIFIALWYWIKNNFLYHRKKIGILLAILTVILLAISIFNFIKASHIQNDIDEYNQSNSKLQNQISDKQKTINTQNKKIEDYSISSSPKIVRASNILSTVFHGMYEYDDGKEYTKNRNKNMKYFSDQSSDDVKKIYNEDKDSANDSIIDNLNLESSLLEYNIFTKNIKEKDSREMDFTAIVEYQSHILGVSSDYSSRTHQTIYDIKFDTKDNKITSIKKVNTLNQNRNVE